MLAEDKITSVNDAPVKAQSEHTEADGNDNDGNEEDGTGVHEQSSGAPRGKQGNSAEIIQPALTVFDVFGCL